MCSFTFNHDAFMRILAFTKHSSMGWVINMCVEFLAEFRIQSIQDLFIPSLCLSLSCVFLFINNLMGVCGMGVYVERDSESFKCKCDRPNIVWHLVKWQQLFEYVYIVHWHFNSHWKSEYNQIFTLPTRNSQTVQTYSKLVSKVAWQKRSHRNAINSHSQEASSWWKRQVALKLRLLKLHKYLYMLLSKYQSIWILFAKMGGVVTCE